MFSVTWEANHVYRFQKIEKVWHFATLEGVGVAPGTFAALSPSFAPGIFQFLRFSALSLWGERASVASRVRGQSVQRRS